MARFKAVLRRTVIVEVEVEFDGTPAEARRWLKADDNLLDVVLEGEVNSDTISIQKLEPVP